MPTVPTTESLWHRYRQSRDTRLRDQLYRENERLALKIAQRMAAENPEPIEDLSQLCRIGLLKAIERFNPAQGVAFSSFAVPYIRGEVLHFQRDHFGSHLKIPRRIFETVGAVKRTQKKMEQMGRPVTLDECARAHGISQQQWQWMSAAVQRKPLVSLEDALHLSTEGDNEDIERTQMHRAVLAHLAQLPKLKRECLSEKFFHHLSDEQIARRHKLSVLQLQTLIQESLDHLARQLQEARPC